MTFKEFVTGFVVLPQTLFPLVSMQLIEECKNLIENAEIVYEKVRTG